MKRGTKLYKCKDFSLVSIQVDGIPDQTEPWCCAVGDKLRKHFYVGKHFFKEVIWVQIGNLSCIWVGAEQQMSCALGTCCSKASCLIGLHCHSSKFSFEANQKITETINLMWRNDQPLKKTKTVCKQWGPGFRGIYFRAWLWSYQAVLDRDLIYCLCQ